jgi:hypothetical protein
MVGAKFEFSCSAASLASQHQAQERMVIEPSALRAATYLNGRR